MRQVPISLFANWDTFGLQLASDQSTDRRVSRRNLAGYSSVVGALSRHPNTPGTHTRFRASRKPPSTPGLALRAQAGALQAGALQAAALQAGTLQARALQAAALQARALQARAL